MNLKLRKQKLSITIIGKQRFWIGVSAGIISAYFFATISTVFGLG